MIQEKYLKFYQLYASIHDELAKLIFAIVTILVTLKTWTVRVISKKALKECWEKHPDAEKALRAWYREMCLGDWINSNQLKMDFPSASVLGEKRIIFNIKGNQYRLVVRVNFHFQLIWIRFVGTHQEYDKIDAHSI